ncbi:uncharacterized protein LOC105253667 isoform X2 [Camponotus floridanus]|uniref:uncharacterized protein LOC105253667 isoform X2 n=1 Tax=Camponotus floridanus TaxID=104421 RepID=UPI000DC66DED|nr:uncharacterized protein LOC105253667 isoform X2 [Camponotus floridanus]
MNKNTDLQNISNAVHLSQDIYEISEMTVKHDEQSQSSVSIVSNVKRKRGRPRKVKNNSIDQNISNSSKNDNIVQDISDIITESTYTVRSTRNSNKIRVTTNVSDLSDESDTTNVKDEPIVKKRGRPVGTTGRGRGRGRGRNRGRGRGIIYNSLDLEYVPKMTRRDSQVEKLEILEHNLDLDKTNTIDSVSNCCITENSITNSNSSNIEKNVQLVTCAKCNQQISKRQWSSHNLHKHNNMAWQENEEPLDFENNIKLLEKVLTHALKKKKHLTCEKCENTKRSVKGFISHMQFCGKSEEEKQALMVTCSICKSVMMPSSMEMHKRYSHKQLEQNKNKETSIIVQRTKRKAAEKAMPKIFESMKEQEPAKKIELDSSIFKNVIQMPELKKKIPTVWKGMWKKEIASQGTTSCKQLGCTYICSSYESICEHYSQCNFTPQENFICKICKFFADSKDKIIDHITEAHSGKEDLDKHSDFEKDEADEDSSEEDIIKFDVKKKYRSSKQTQINSDGIYNKMTFLDKEIMQNPQSTKPYKPSIHWTLEFELKNYELTLFEDNMPNAFTLLENNNAIKYLPELTISMAIKNVKLNSSQNEENSNNDTWKHLNRFESDIYETVPTFFVGGPVWALAWLPIPSSIYTKNPTQYVAISTHPTMEKEYTVGNKYSGPNIIQIWNVGSLNHNIDSTNKLPVLAYAIAHNNGTIWCLEWCPSGCYQDIVLGNYKAEENKLRRMGLLAAACSDGCVNIYSLPFPDELKFEKTEYNSLPIYKTDPVIILVVNQLLYDSNKQNWQCTKLSWTKEHGHNIIAAGFTNGYIALWDLTSTCPMLVNMRKNTKLINTFQHFFAHHNTISMIAIVPYGKSRFLASGSTDRSYKFWDLEDTSTPRHCTKKGIILDGTWMTHWPCSVMSFDDALGYQYTHSCIIPLREYGYKYFPILPTNSPTYSITVSDYANSIAHGTLAGQIITIFPHQLLYTEKILSKKRQLNSFIKTVDFLKDSQNANSNGNKNDKKNSKDYHYMPETYNECKDRFGIIFHDKLTGLKEIVKEKQHCTLYNNVLTSIPIEQYPFTSANKVAWNPNAWSYLWLMVGYQNGLMRLLNLTFMSSHDLNTSLSSHVKCVLAKRNTSTQ